jgi:hypothetical protein
VVTLSSAHLFPTPHLITKIRAAFSTFKQTRYPGENVVTFCSSDGRAEEAAIRCFLSSGRRVSTIMHVRIKSFHEPRHGGVKHLTNAE